MLIRIPDGRLVRENPHNDIIASLLMSIPGSRFSTFPDIVRSFVSTCSNPEVVELIIKIDSEDCIGTSSVFNKCLSVLSRIPMKYKIVCYPRFQGVSSNYHVLNHLASLADGHTIWPIDVSILGGDWLSLFVSARGTFSDNIYTINIVGNKLSMNGIPAISIEWLRFFGCFLPTFYGDRFVRNLGKSIKRIIHDQTIIFKHIHSKGPRIMPKRTQKYLTNKFMVGYIDMFHKKHSV